MDYAQELELKRTHVHSCLTRIGGQTLASLPITGAEQTDGYRNKVQFPVQEQNGKPVAGFSPENAHGHSGRALPHPAGLRRTHPRSRSGLDAQIQHPRL